MYYSENETRIGEASTTLQRGLLDAAVMTIGSALQAQHAGAPADRDALRPSIRWLCHEAHRRGVLAEQLVIVIKQAWASLPVSREPRREARREDLRRTMITMCIDEFYTTNCAAGPGG